jgi:hypothetical protein
MPPVLPLINGGNFSAKTEPKPDAPVVEKTGVASRMPTNGASSKIFSSPNRKGIEFCGEPVRPLAGSPYAVAVFIII